MTLSPLCNIQMQHSFCFKVSELTASVINNRPYLFYNWLSPSHLSNLNQFIMLGDKSHNDVNNLPNIALQQCFTEGSRPQPHYLDHKPMPLCGIIMTLHVTQQQRHFSAILFRNRRTCTCILFCHKKWRLLLTCCHCCVSETLEKMHTTWRQSIPVVYSAYTCRT